LKPKKLIKYLPFHEEKKVIKVKYCRKEELGNVKLDKLRKGSFRGNSPTGSVKMFLTDPGQYA
jgi:hypothetical protein